MTVGRYRIAEFLEPPGDRAAATLHAGVGPTTGAGRGIRIEVCSVGVPNQRRDQPDERIRRAPGHADGAEARAATAQRHRELLACATTGRRAVCNGRSVTQTVRCHCSSIAAGGRGDELGKIRWPLDQSVGNEPNHQRTPVAGHRSAR